ncbi:hypothetical protein XENOCAPTIV_005534 [Xenoophorus captivus]|uniref:Rab-GAP TBC domain-containing protein n=1 Tax=Xenoophorus captivus TaxID=1517983 RepID=A0ABV0RX07_9TELE
MEKEGTSLQPGVINNSVTSIRAQTDGKPSGRSNPDDDSLGIQIVKVTRFYSYSDGFWFQLETEGFNVLAALILEVTEGNESDALKVMIYLIDKVLPDSYFANNLRALSGSYEPPLTNVFTMQWFLTMFATCLPAPTVLKIWDSVFFEGSEVLFRVALAIWERLGERIEECQTADEFYSTMGCLTQEMLEHDLVNPAELMQDVYSMAVFPFPQLAELREKYTYNITPFSTSVKSKGSEDDGDMDEESVATALGCLGPLGGLLAPELQRYQKHLKGWLLTHILPSESKRKQALIRFLQTNPHFLLHHRPSGTLRL